MHKGMLLREYAVIMITFDKTSKIIKRVNIVVYVIMNYLLALILSVINAEKLGIDLLSIPTVILSHGGISSCIYIILVNIYNY